MSELGVVNAIGMLAAANGVLLLLCLLVGLLLRRVARRQLEAPVSPEGSSALRDFVAGWGLGLAALAVTIAPAWIGGGYKPGPGYAAFESMLTQAVPPILLWLLFAVQSLIEELIFRGLALPLLGVGAFAATLVAARVAGRSLDVHARRRAWWWCGVLINLVLALVFGAVHAANPNVSLLAIVNVVLAGLALGQLLWSTGRITGPWALHWVWNATIASLGLPVSGIRVGPAMLPTGIEGARDGLLTGGSFGPEGALPCTVALGGLYLWLLLSSRPKAAAVEALAADATEATVVVADAAPAEVEVAADDAVGEAGEAEG